jgi:hypothetical protein
LQTTQARSQLAVGRGGANSLGQNGNHGLHNENDNLQPQKAVLVGDGGKQKEEKKSEKKK